MEAKKNFMVDWETLSTTPDAVVRCISVIPFTLCKEEEVEAILARELTVWFSVEEQIAAGRVVDEETLGWWEKKLSSPNPDEASMAALILDRGPSEADPQLGMQIVAAYILDEAPDGLIFSRGSNFDFPIYEHLSAQVGVPLPFSTWKVTCSKSILRFACNDEKDLEAGLVGGLKSNHNSAFDCAVEIKKLQALYAALRGD